MSAANAQVSMNKITDVLESIRKKGVRLWSKHGQLRYKAPQGALTPEEIERLRAHREQIVTLLERVNIAEAVGPTLELRRRLRRVPLAFSQLAHWHLYRLSERQAIRQIASATRLCGRLNIDALQESVAEIVHRHDALRTRIVVLDGVPMQEIVESENFELRMDDLTALSGDVCEMEIQRLIEQVILKPVDVSVDPLFAIRIIRLHDDEHVLVVAMEHMISDAYSMNILLRELFSVYVQMTKSCAFSLPPISVQFSEYAVWQRNAQASWIEKHEAYWNERLAGFQQLIFPGGPHSTTRLGWGIVPLRIGKDLKIELREWCRREQTTLAMSVFTVYVALVLRWCSASESVIRYQSDGRVSPRTENTIGYFASILYLRVELLAGDDFVTLMRRVTKEYCQAYEHSDFSYMAAQMPTLDFTRSTAFNWIPSRSTIDLSDLHGSDDAMTSSPVRFVHPMLKDLELDHDPAVVLCDTFDEIIGEIAFPLHRFPLHTMERFGRNFLVFMRTLLREPGRRVKDISLL